jgi:Predicted secreted protein
MQIGSIIAIYFVVWWLCLFMVLPFKVHNQIDEGRVVPGTEPGAPVLLRLWPKLLAATVLAGVLTALLMWGLTNPTLREYWS